MVQAMAANHAPLKFYRTRIFAAQGTVYGLRVRAVFLDLRLGLCLHLVLLSYRIDITDGKPMAVYTGAYGG
jgi:hypothetical protein